MEDILTKLRASLEQARGMHSQIAEETGIDATTISRILRGEVDPRVGTVEKLRAWLADNPPPYVTVSASKVAAQQ